MVQTIAEMTTVLSKVTYLVKKISQRKNFQDPTLEKDERRLQGQRWLEMKPKYIHVGNFKSIKNSKCTSRKNIFRE